MNMWLMRHQPSATCNILQRDDLEVDRGCSHMVQQRDLVNLFNQTISLYSQDMLYHEA